MRLKGVVPDGATVQSEAAAGSRGKRVARLRMDGNQQLLTPLHHMADCAYHHYCLQLNIYRFILESSEYGFRVSRMMLGIVHPEREGPMCLELPRLEREIELIVQHARVT